MPSCDTRIRPPISRTPPPFAELLLAASIPAGSLNILKRGSMGQDIAQPSQMWWCSTRHVALIIPCHRPAMQQYRSNTPVASFSAALVPLCTTHVGQRPYQYSSSGLLKVIDVDCWKQRPYQYSSSGLLKVIDVDCWK